MLGMITQDTDHFKKRKKNEDSGTGFEHILV